ncbi:hypothetical protein C8J57DRAFT_1232577 [Mycena rebaudengoi]|nr:hypothetical protein C8J57DRAFT_1232577 [Mycena rebaudengoi]
MAARGNSGYWKRGDSAAASQDTVKPAVGRRKFNKKSRPAVHAKKVAESKRHYVPADALTIQGFETPKTHVEDKPGDGEADGETAKNQLKKGGGDTARRCDGRKVKGSLRSWGAALRVCARIPKSKRQIVRARPHAVKAWRMQGARKIEKGEGGAKRGRGCGE